MLAAVTATSRVLSPTSSAYCAAGSSPVATSASAQRTTAPARAAAWIHGRMLASWSSRDTTISSPGAQPRASAADIRYVSAVMLGPKTTPDAAPPVRSATARRASATIAPERSLAANAPPVFPIPARYAAAIASMTGTGTCVPAAPSR